MKTLYFFNNHRPEPETGDTPCCATTTEKPAGLTRTVKNHNRVLFLWLSLMLLILLPGMSWGQIAQRGTATFATSSNTNLTITKPTGVVAGDVMIVNISKNGNDTNDPSLSGWTLIAGADLGGTTQRRASLLYKVAGASEPANYTFALGSGTNASVGAIVAFSGVDATVIYPKVATFKIRFLQDMLLLMSC